MNTQGGSPTIDREIFVCFNFCNLFISSVLLAITIDNVLWSKVHKRMKYIWQLKFKLQAEYELVSKYRTTLALVLDHHLTPVQHVGAVEDDPRFLAQMSAISHKLLKLRTIQKLQSREFRRKEKRSIMIISRWSYQVTSSLKKKEELA